MRKGDAEWGIWEMTIAIFAIVILVVIALVLIAVINPGSTAASGFGNQASEVLNR